MQIPEALSSSAEYDDSRAVVKVAGVDNGALAPGGALIIFYPPLLPPPLSAPLVIRATGEVFFWVWFWMIFMADQGLFGRVHHRFQENSTVGERTGPFCVHFALSTLFE